ncbi:tetratricopeptide repeat protein [Kordiimonas aestuarii]|uniref:tetratricopeptide repeat protein n=1 Tax=Kordiimonas aestuarii TaxID=1005925 RepID=UPI0021CEB035|nr:tetratricopeptide repeat protein [Kordiimonas aestuarii]
MRFIIKPALIASFGLLAACGGSEEEEAEKIDYASFDDKAVQQLVDDGEYQKALEVIKAQDELEISDKTDFLTAADIYLNLLDGVAAEVAIEDAREAGASDGEILLKLSRALLLQQKFKKADEILNDTSFEGEEKFQALLLRGDIAQQKQDIQGARYFYRLAIEEKPEDFRGYLGMALLSLNQGQLTEANAFADEAASRVEDDPIVQYVKGAVARYERRTEDAEKHLLKAVDLHSGNMLAYFELIGMYIETGQLEKAQEQLDSVYALVPNNPMAQYFNALILAVEGKTQEAEYMLLRTGDFTRTFPPAARTYGHIAFELGKYSTAQPYLERFLSQAPADRSTRLKLAECLTRRGQSARALLYLEPLIGEGSEDIEGLLQAAAANGAQGNIVETRTYIERANEIAKAAEDMDQNLIAQLGQRLALTRFISGDEVGAIAELQALYSNAEGDAESLTLLANMQMENGDLSGAVATAKRILEVEPDSAVGNNLLGAVAYRHREIDAAMTFYNKALEQNPDYQSALKNRGLANLTANKFEAAKKDFEAVLSKGAEDAQVHAMLGRAYLELGNGKDAATHLKQAEAIIPESAIISTDLAEALTLSGLRSSGITQAQKAKRLAKADENLMQYIDDLIVKWQKEELQAQKDAEAEREKRREELAKKREEMEKARRALIEDGSLKDKETPPPEGADEPKNEGDPDEGEAEGDAEDGTPGLRS